MAKGRGGNKGQSGNVGELPPNSSDEESSEEASRPAPPPPGPARCELCPSSAL